MNKGLMIIDGNSVGRAAHNTVPSYDGEGNQTQATIGTLKTLRRLTTDYSETYQKMWILWDHKAKFRYEILPSYKGKRADTKEKVDSSEDYYRQRPNICDLIALLGIKQISATNYEADDIAGMLSRRVKSPTLLVTGDQDWQQLVTPFISWKDHRVRGPHCTYDDFKEKTSFDTPIQFLQAKAILGDTSDNIPGIRGLGSKAVERIFDQYGSVSALMAAKKRGELEKDRLPNDLTRFHKALNSFTEKKGMDQFRMNLQLMDLLSGKRDDDIIRKMYIRQEDLDVKGFEELCFDLGLGDVSRNIKLWKRTFGAAA